MHYTLFILIAKVYLLHAFHVSVCDVVYNSDDKHLKISVRLFLDDLEKELKIYSKNPQLDISQIDPTTLNHTMEQYFTDKFGVSVQEEKINLVFLGSEIENDALWCYLEYEKMKPFLEMTISNELLFLAFDDQDNLVHVRKDGVVKSLRLYPKKAIATVSW
ncbi:MAG: hypothetical protein HQ474_05110 [Flammeovirgaceae bacterium]|jgi:hypothetical protein|nr:hypothetical protein [Flammeovirgaceae bacterium]NQW27270.1 hypothetical protein [Flammeovirgaceae bacterium]|tara:strand:- start:7469 stop:7951 length:483 start_codon:yes stop_codon:yes gene_type:complete